MEYDLDGIKRVLKIIGVVVSIIILLATSIFLAFMFVMEQEKVIELKSERSALENRLDEAEIKIAEQESEINSLINPVKIDDKGVTGESVMPTIDLLNKALADLQSGDEKTIRVWFGYGSEYTVENIVEYTKDAKITIIKDKKTPEGYIAIHVCNLNNKKKLLYKSEMTKEYLKKNVAMSEYDREELVNQKVADKILNGEMDKHFSLYVRSTGSILEVTDELKQALTGGWYVGTSETMAAYKCIYEK